MTALEVKEYVINALEMDVDDASDCEVYKNTEFFMHLNAVLRGITLDRLNRNLTGYKNLKKRIKDIVPASVPSGHYGHDGRYKLPSDFIQLKQATISLNGECWVNARVENMDEGLRFHYKCNDCKCEKNCGGVWIRHVNNYIEIEPLPKLEVPNGLVLYYEAMPEKVTELEQELPFNDIDLDYVVLLLADYYMAIHSDQYSQTKVGRLFNKFNRAKMRFDKYNGLQTRGRVQKKHERPRY